MHAESQMSKTFRFVWNNKMYRVKTCCHWQPFKLQPHFHYITIVLCSHCFIHKRWPCAKAIKLLVRINNYESRLKFQKDFLILLVHFYKGLFVLLWVLCRSWSGTCKHIGVSETLFRGAKKSVISAKLDIGRPLNYKI